MFITTLFSILSFIAATAVASATPTTVSRAGYKQLNPLVAREVYTPAIVPQSLTNRELTNGQRLAAGLPLRKPSRRTNDTPKAVPSGTPSLATRGYLEILQAGTGKPLGFVRNTFNPFGEYARTTKENERLVVEIKLAEADRGPVNIATLNGPNVEYPCFGAVQGYSSTSSDLLFGSSNYAHLGGMIATAPGSPATNVANSVIAATLAGQSAVWTCDSWTKIVSPKWVNDDFSRPKIFIGLIQETIVITADPDEFCKTYGETEWVRLAFSEIENK